MLKNLIIVLVCGVLLWSCGNDDRPPKPSNLITKEKMADILFDLYIINAAKGVNRKVLEQRSLVPETYLLTKHDIDSAQFADSNNYWAFNTEDYNSIVESVKTKLANKKKQLENLQKKEQEDAKRRRDSLRRNNIQKTEKDSSSIG